MRGLSGQVWTKETPRNFWSKRVTKGNVNYSQRKIHAISVSTFIRCGRVLHRAAGYGESDCGLITKSNTDFRPQGNQLTTAS